MIEQLDNIMAVKVGTANMFCHQNGREVLDYENMCQIGSEVIALRALGYHVPLISSGAVTAGMEVANIRIRPTGEEAMPEIQRLAALGWHHVLKGWEDAMPGLRIGGMLLTQSNLNPETPEHDEALRTIHTMLRHGDQPGLNENDPITHGELSHESFVQNDTLGALFGAQIAGSELFGEHIGLVLLTDVDGVYEVANDSSTLIREMSLDDIDHYEHVAGESKSKHGKGGMKTKFEAAKIALSAGVEMWIANGRTENAIQRAIEGEIGTHLLAAV